MIQVSGLKKYYNKGKKNEQYVLKDVSLEFEETGLVCILGESGSGKTTLLNAIGGLDDFSGGEIRIADATIKGYSPKTVEPIRNEHFGYIFQNYYLLNDHTVAYNVKLALNRYELSEKEKEERVSYVLRMLGMEKYKKKLVSMLSGGQQQRVSIARALVKAPDIILADEPTGNLDEENTLRTMSILKSISKECLVILVTHEKRIARFFADRIIEVCDGKIVRDEKNVAAAYERSDDANLYLKEYEETSIQNEFAQFKLYTEPGEKRPDIRINIVWKDNKMYLQNLTEDTIVLEGEESGVCILDEERPKLELEDIEYISFQLPRLKGKGKAHLPFREIWRMAVENIRMLGRKQAFIAGILLTAGCLLTVTLAQFSDKVSVNEKSAVTTDSHYVKLDFKNVSNFFTEEQLEVLRFAWNYLEDTTYGTVFVEPDVRLYLTGKDFYQMEDLLQMMPEFSYVPKEYLSEDTLLMGSMPQKRNEVVVDYWLIENLMESDGVVSAQYTNMEDYLGAELKTAVSDTELTIVGICDTGEPAIYCGQNALLGFSSKGYEIASDIELRQEELEGYEKVELQEGEFLMREGLASALGLSIGDSYFLGDDSEHVYELAGTFPDDRGYDYVFSEEGCQNVRDLMIYQNRTCFVYSSNIEETMAYFEGLEGEALGKFTLECSVPYQEEIETYKEARAGDFGATQLITFLVAVVSLVMIYFTMKSNAMARCEELTVYSLLGISKSSILRSYVLEMLLLTTVTSMPAVLLTSMILKFVGAIPSLEMEFLFPWWIVLALLSVIYIVNAIISILPVYTILQKPPAELAVKE